MSTEHSFLRWQMGTCFPPFLRPVSSLLVFLRSQVSTSPWKASSPFSSWVLFLQLHSSDWHFSAFPISPCILLLLGYLPIAAFCIALAKPSLSRLPCFKQNRVLHLSFGVCLKILFLAVRFQCREARIK